MSFSFFPKKQIYLDHASSTPLSPRVARVQESVSRRVYGNPSALHRLGVLASNIISEARETIARALGAHADEIIFVSGGTEGDNLAIFGVVRAFQKKYPEITPHIIVSAIEHAAVLESARLLEEEGCLVTYLPVSNTGIVPPDTLRKAIRPETILVSVMLANNEIGTIQPIRAIAKEVRHARRHREEGSSIPTVYPLLHTDACQALQYIQIEVEQLGVDLLSCNGSKIYGPKGIGALYIKRGTPIEQLFQGGDQEFGFRPGTESVPLIASFAEAVRETLALRESETKRLTILRDTFIQDLEKKFPRMQFHGDRVARLPNNINVTFPGYSGEMLVVYLDARGIYASVKSACKSKDPEASHVIAALGTANDTTSGSIRFSLGRGTTKSDLARVVKELQSIMTLLA